MNRKYTTNGVLIQAESERQADLLGNAGTAVSRIVLLYMSDGIDDLSGWTLWTSLLTATR